MVSTRVFPAKTYWPRLILLSGNLAVPAATIAAAFPWPMMWLAFGFHAALLLALVVPRCAWLMPMATRFETNAREIWLTIDDGPDGENTISLANQLARRGVRATFFVIEKNLARHPEAARALLEAGHTLANHTATHPAFTFWFLLPNFLRREIDSCNDALRGVGVASSRWFRAPAGLKNLFLFSFLKRRGMRLVAWSLRGHDGWVARPEAVRRRITKGARPGDIVVLHEGRAQSNRTILAVVDALLARGFAFTIPADEKLL